MQMLSAYSKTGVDGFPMILGIVLQYMKLDFNLSTLDNYCKIRMDPVPVLGI